MEGAVLIQRRQGHGAVADADAPEHGHHLLVGLAQIDLRQPGGVFQQIHIDPGAVGKIGAVPVADGGDEEFAVAGHILDLYLVTGAQVFFRQQLLSLGVGQSVGDGIG